MTAPSSTASAGAPMSAGARRQWRRARHSLRARLTALFLLLALAMALTFVAGTQTSLRFGWQGYARPLIADYVDSLTAEIGTPPDVAKAQALTRRLPLRIRIEGPVVNWSSHGDNSHSDERLDRDARRRAEHPQRPDNPWRPTRLLSDGHRISFGLAVLPREESPDDRPRLIGWATLGVLLVLVGFAYASVRRLLHPLVDIRAGAIRYGQGDFSTPIALRTRDELGDLAHQINGMAEGLHRLLDAKRGLLLAISHELRSPLTRARVNAELIDDSAARDALLHDLAQMRDLITDLLESERLALGHAALHTEATDVNALARELIAKQFADRAIATELDPTLPTIALDPVRIRLLMRNLLDNALRHSAEASTPPLLTTRSDGDSLRLTVRDHGAGVDAAQLPLLTDAFHRTDAARQRATGGVGLGLYLCRLVAQAHGGSIAIRNAEPGLEVAVRLPLRRH